MDTPNHHQDIGLATETDKALKRRYVQGLEHRREELVKQPLEMFGPFLGFRT